ncbi:hypothetical protein F0562_007372 [Nyssa sinensis]|uniref:CTLH domain-containing protein n=1 Tax=Nyssa sinensis TaxID=561372 RepID=A0A5J5A820_9ASTE|nr:hypothetical protein F0562_007372 [Nyssa sinensis]
MSEKESKNNNAGLRRDLIYLILQYLNEEKYNDTVHEFERETGSFFNVQYIEDLLLAGNWEVAEKYISGFTKVEDNQNSRKIIFEIRKQKYLEVLDRLDRATAAGILQNELKVFAREKVYKDLTHLITLNNFREHPQFLHYNSNTARTMLVTELKKLFRANPILRYLILPNMPDSRLKNLINQSLKWQHMLCKTPLPNYEIHTLFMDHKCYQPKDSYAQPSSSNQQNVSGSRAEDFKSVQPCQPIAVPARSPLPSWMLNIPNVTQPEVLGATMEVQTNQVALLNNLRTSDDISTSRPSGISDRLTLLVTSPGGSDSPVFNLTDELPMTVVRTLNQGSCPRSMDFHPFTQSLLLVGTNVGDIGLWDVGLGEKIDSHIGSVYDLAFSCPRKKLSVITCGDDQTIRVWDAITGAKLFTFEGHKAPVYSVCPNTRENTHFILSTSMDGKIKAWLYDMSGSKIDFNAPGGCCTTMAYSTDGKSQNGQTHIVEWVESEGLVERTYQGFHKRSLGIVQFDTAKNRFLAAADDHLIKFWEMDNANLLMTFAAGGDLPANPSIRYNKEGTLLAVSTNDNRVKILATLDGIHSLRAYETRATASRIASEASCNIGPLSAFASKISTKVNGDTRNMMDVEPILSEDHKSMKTWKLTEFDRPSQFLSLVLPVTVEANKIMRLIYTNSGDAILALGSNAIHLLWKWPRHNCKATTKCPPNLWHPPSKILMTNDSTYGRPEESASCFALSKNDSYLVSSSGGKISLFNMLTFKTMMTFIHPPPVPTCLAFHPQDNNIIAIGMDDCTVQIFNVRVTEVTTKLKGHSERITGLAFSSVLNSLVSAGADARIIVWQSNEWIGLKSTSLDIPGGRSAIALSDIHVHFHQDQIHFLAVHETQLAMYETTKMERVKQWLVAEFSPPLCHATFSCDSQLVYACFLDGTVGIFCSSNLQLQCIISPTAYLPSSASSPVYPIVIATHPQECNQFALGLTDGSVHVFEPLESEGQWGTPPVLDNGSPSNIPTAPPAVASGSGGQPDG